MTRVIKCDRCGAICGANDPVEIHECRRAKYKNGTYYYISNEGTPTYELCNICAMELEAFLKGGPADA